MSREREDCITLLLTYPCLLYTRCAHMQVCSLWGCGVLLQKSGSEAPQLWCGAFLVFLCVHKGNKPVLNSDATDIDN